MRRVPNRHLKQETGRAAISREKLPSVRHLKGNKFFIARFEEATFHNDHDHCAACAQKIAEQDWPEVDHDGYVTKVAFDDRRPPRDFQWNWVCKKCFRELREAMAWKIGTKDEFNKELYPSRHFLTSSRKWPEV